MNREPNRFPVLIAALALVALAAGIATASTVTQNITYQGKLTNAAGTPLTGTYSVQFSLYEAASGGTALASATQSITCTGGLFTTSIAFDQALFTGRALWLGIKVGSDPEMTPRQEIRPAPYALGLRPGAWITGTDITPALNLVTLTGGVPALNISTAAFWTRGIDIKTTGEMDWGIHADIQGDSSKGIVVWSSGDNSQGIYAVANGAGSIAILGSSGTGTGVAGVSIDKAGISGDSTNFIGVLGRASAYPGVQGESTNAAGVSGVSQTSVGVLGSASSNSGVRGISTDGAGVDGQSTNWIGVYGASIHGTGVAGRSTDLAGVSGDSTNYIGVLGRASAHPGVRGESTNAAGVQGESTTDVGVYGTSTENAGVHGFSTSKAGLWGVSENDVGLYAVTNRADNKYGIYTPDYLYAKGTQVPSSDVAEYMPVVGNAGPGTVLVITDSEKLAPASAAYDTRVAGIVSTEPGVSLGTREDGNPGEALVAVAGRVPCRVDAGYGVIRPGDLLSTSDTPGHARKAEPVMINGRGFYPAGTILGKAMGSLESGTGTIDVLVTLQ